ncbi:MAG: AraC-like DNA-binding protein [Saprospiraceae bacterium]|jgi:AraC-like DNA-binding protein
MNVAINSPKILVSAANGVIEHIEKNNGSVSEIFSRSHIHCEVLDNPLEMIELSQFCDLFEHSAGQTGNDNFGLHFGAAFAPERLGAIGYIAISSPTLAAALKSMIRYFPAHQGHSSFQLTQDSDLLWLNYRILDEKIVNRRQDAELSLGMFVNIFRHALGKDWAPLEVHFEHHRPDKWSDHESIFNAPVNYGRRTNSMAFRRSDLDALMPEQDPFLYSVIESALSERRAKIADQVDFATSVKNEIRLRLGESPPSVVEISRIFGLSSKTLQRQLREQKLSFQNLLSAARQDLSIHYLSNENITLTEIAHRLGYSELSAYSRAFSAWTGMNPQRFRRNLLKNI